MTANGVVRSTVLGQLRPHVRRIALAFGAGFLALVVVPISTAAVIALSGGSEVVAMGLAGVGLLGFLLVLAALPLAAVGLVWLLGIATASTLATYVTDQRLHVLHRVEEIEEASWWGSLVRPSDMLAFLDPRSPAERFEADLDDAKRAYVVGDVSEAGLERRLDRLFGLETVGDETGHLDGRQPSPRLNDPEERREAEFAGRLTR